MTATSDAYASSTQYHVCWCGQVYVQRAGTDPHHSHGGTR